MRFFSRSLPNRICRYFCFSSACFFAYAAAVPLVASCVVTVAIPTKRKTISNTAYTIQKLGGLEQGWWSSLARSIPSSENYTYTHTHQHSKIAFYDLQSGWYVR